METVKNYNNIEQILESLLFTASRPMKSKELAKILEMPEAEILAALDKMVESKKDNGIILLKSSEGFQLATNSACSTQVKNFLNAELREKLTDATVEVLAIIAYRQPISKAEIEAIRGVNSQYSIRNLLMRGMIEKVANPTDARSVMYQTTTEFLMHMGLSSNKDLPEFEKLVEQIKLPETPALAQVASIETVTEEIPPTPAPAEETAATVTEEYTEPKESTQDETLEEDMDEDDEEEDEDDDDEGDDDEGDDK